MAGAKKVVSVRRIRTKLESGKQDLREKLIIRQDAYPDPPLPPQHVKAFVGSAAVPTPKGDREPVRIQLAR